MATAGSSLAQTSGFTYQGKLGNSGAPANGSYDLRFTLWNFDSGGTQQPQPSPVTVTRTNVAVANGVFTVQIDFGPEAFPEDASRWLEISVRLNGSGDEYTVLSPRQQINSVPFVVRSLIANNADKATNATNALYASDAGTATTAGNVTGVVAVANGGTGRDTQDFVDLRTNQRIAGNKEFEGTVAVVGAAAQFIGNGSGLTNLNGANLTDGSLTNSKLAHDYKNGYDPLLVARLRWDLLPVVPNRVEVGRQPSALAFDGTFMYVANKLDNNVMRIRTKTGLIEGSPIAVGTAPSALAYDGTFMWVANSGSNNVTKIRARTGAVEGSPIGVGTNPVALAFDGSFLYVANYGSSSLTRINVSSGAVEGGPITVGNRPKALVFDGTFVYVSHQIDGGTAGDVRRIRASTGAVEGEPISFGNPGALAFDGTFVYVAQRGVNSDASKVERIRASTGLKEALHVRASKTDSLLLVFDGTFLYASSSLGTEQNSQIIRLNINGLGVDGGAIPLTGIVGAFAFDGTYIYAASDLSVSDPNGQLTTFINGNVIRFQ